MHTLTIPLRTTEYDRIRMDKAFNCIWHIHNILVSEALHRLNRVKFRKDYHELLTEYQYIKKDAPAKDQRRKRFLSKQMADIRKEAGLTSFGLQQYALVVQKRYKQYISSHQAQKEASRVFAGIEKLLFGKGKSLHYKKRAAMSTISSKSANGARLKNDQVLFAGMSLKLIYNSDDLYMQQSLNADLRYIDIKRLMFSDGWHYYAVLVLDGSAPLKHALGGNETIGIDPGVSSMACVGDTRAEMFELAPKAREYNRRIAHTQHYIDREQRLSNPDNYEEDGTVKKGRHRWTFSKHCRRKKRLLTTLYRKKAAYIRQSHFEQTNNLLENAGKIAIEVMNYKALQRRAKTLKRQNKKSAVKSSDGSAKMVRKYQKRKRFGKSLTDRAPSQFVAILRQRCNQYDIPMIEIDTMAFRASQYRHDTDTYEKIPLSQRRKTISGHMVLRDLYSAFLIKNSNEHGTAPIKEMCRHTFRNFLYMQDDMIQRAGDRKRPACFGF
jgi:hypothetical protein